MDGENNRDQPDNVVVREANNEIVGSGNSGSRSSSRERRQAPHWSQPCSNLINDTDQNTTAAALSDHIINSVVRAMHHLNTFNDAYAKSSLDMTWEKALDQVQYYNMEFINIPPVPEDKSQLDFNETLAAAYEQMQRLAVGIEQVTLDQALYDSDFLQQFRTVEGHIVKILCQLHFAMIHRQVTPQVNITREIMGEHYRDLVQGSARKFRDITILREYKSGLNYANEIFTHFHTNDPQN